MFLCYLNIIQHLVKSKKMLVRILLGRCLQNIQSDVPFLKCIDNFDKCVLHVDRNLRKHNIRICGANNLHKQWRIARDCEGSCIVYNVCESTLSVSTNLMPQASMQRVTWIYCRISFLPSYQIYSSISISSKLVLHLATVYHCNSSLKKFPDEITGRGSLTSWTVCSLYINPVLLFLPKYMKDMVYKTHCPRFTKFMWKSTLCNLKYGIGDGKYRKLSRQPLHWWTK